ncbi:hypothetical protein BLA29_011445, partial [Euroglyphus maynei]
TATPTTIHHCRWQGCSFASSDILEFRNHNRTQHRDESTIIPSRKGKSSSSKDPLICEVPGCGYSPKYRRLLIDHQNAHKGLRAHKCCFCEYNSSYFGDIRKHMIKKHPDLAQEIKLSKLKLKQNGGLIGKKTTKKYRVDEMGNKIETKSRKSSSSQQANDIDPNGGGKGRKRNYNRKNSKKNKKDQDSSMTLNATTANAATTLTLPGGLTL